MELSMAEHDFPCGRTIGQLSTASSLGKSPSCAVAGDNRRDGRASRQFISKHYELGMFVAKPVVIQSPIDNLAIYETTGIISNEAIEQDLIPINEDLPSTPAVSGIAKFPWRSVLLYAWIAASLILASRLLVTFFLGIRLLGRAKPLNNDKIEQAIGLAKLKLGINKDVKIYGSAKIHSPVIWCWRRRPVLLVPSTAARSDNGIDWAGVLCHELAHYKRLDHVAGLLAELTVCFLPWHPLLWLAKSHLISLSEQACDDWVVASGRPGTDYAESLLNLTPEGQMAFVPAVVSSKRDLAGRVRRILKDSCGNPRTGATWALVVSLVTACLAASVAFAQTRPAKPTSAMGKRQDKPTESLHKAAWKGDIEQVRLLISQGADVNERNRNGSTPLHVATWPRHTEVVELLIQKGVEVDAKDRGGYTSLYYAVWHGDNTTARVLVVNGADLNYTPEGEWPPLYYMLWINEKDLVELMVDKGSRAPAFHLAAFRGNLAKVKSIYANGMDVNARDQLNWTPLHWAASGGQKDIAEFLIGKGADVKAESKYKTTLLHSAATKELAELLLSKGLSVNITSGGSTPLHCAAKRGYVSVAEVFISHGVDIEAKDKRGRTALYVASIKGHKETVEFLIAKGAAVNTNDNQGRTALKQAMEWGHTEVVELLRQHGSTETIYGAVAFGDIDEVKRLISQGVDINAKAKREGNTPLIAAVRNGHNEIAELLIAKGADINAKGSRDYTALIRAAINRTQMEGSIELTKLLLARGADIEARQEHGATALACAAYAGNTESAKLLIEHGANIEAKLNDGETTPLLRAVRQEYVETARLLLDKGANIHATWRGLSAVHGAMLGDRLSNRKSDPEMVKLLIEKGLKCPPIHLAAFLGDFGRLKDCLNDGIKIDEGDAAGYTPLHCAVSGDHMDIVKFILGKGANVNAKTNNGWTPLGFIWTTEMAAFLIANGADVRIPSKFGTTALHGAVNRDNHRGDKTLVELLLKHGADINTRAGSTSVGWAGWTPLHVACRNGARDIVELLLARGGDVNAKTDKGETPMALAQINGKDQVIQLLRKHGAKE